ncbi:MAG: hypothetical protein ACO1N0_20325 [Fluviicola sp.]
MRIKPAYTYWKIPVVIVFIAIICIAINLQSEHWISVAKGVLFLSDMTDQQQLELIKNSCFWTVPILSVLFLLIRNLNVTIVIIVLMLINLLLVFPFRYVEDLTVNF